MSAFSMLHKLPRPGFIAMCRKLLVFCAGFACMLSSSLRRISKSCEYLYKCQAKKKKKYSWCPVDSLNWGEGCTRRCTIDLDFDALDGNKGSKDYALYSCSINM